MLKLLKGFIFVFSLLISFSLTAQNSINCIPDRPNPPRLVNDFAHLLSPQQNAQLERQLEELARNTSNRIVVVTVDSICGDKALFTYKIGETWGVGDKKFNN